VNNQTVITKNMLQLQLQQALLSPATLAKTVADTSDPGNVTLAKCLSGAACTATTATGFVLFDPMGNKISGTPAQPLLIDYSGASCAAASAQCLFQVITTYAASCPVASPCTNANVTATYSIQQAPGISPVGGTMQKPISSQPISLSAASTGNFGFKLVYLSSSRYNPPGSVGIYTWVDLGQSFSVAYASCMWPNGNSDCSASVTAVNGTKVQIWVTANNPPGPDAVAIAYWY
jgi:hypothetical protein